MSTTFESCTLTGGYGAQALSSKSGFFRAHLTTHR